MTTAKKRLLTCCLHGRRQLYDHAGVCGYAFFGIRGDFPCSKQICPADSFPLF